jgi:hypothetical protein
MNGNRASGEKCATGICRGRMRRAAGRFAGFSRRLYLLSRGKRHRAVCDKMRNYAEAYFFRRSANSSWIWMLSFLVIG